MPDLPPLHVAPAELNPVMPRMMRLRPLVGAPSLEAPALAPAPAIAPDQLRADAILRRERAEQAIDRPSTAASAAAAPSVAPVAYVAPVAPPPPTEEERQLRAEHLKRQRAMLLEKRKAERDQQLQAHQATRGGESTVDRMLAARAAAPPPPGAAAAFTAPTGEAPPPDTAEAAQRMRQALTLQLRQTLTSTVPDTSLGENISQLENMKMSGR